MQKLKTWRRDAANLEGIEAFRVFANKVLENIAELKPSNKEELMAMKGIRDRKFAKYGEKILAIINEYDRDGGDQEETGPVLVKPDKILSVQDLIFLVNSHLSTLGSLKVKGEITEVNSYPGFCFFTIKDTKTSNHTVNCFIGRVGLTRFNYLLEAGMEMVVTVVPGLYKSGRFNLTVSHIEPYGEGALRKAFEALKKKLEAKGYFDPSRKRPIPEFVRKIGLVTSESGAAIRDFRTNLGNYGFKIYLKDVRVEGDQAEISIISAINWLNKYMPELDVIVLLRGGGNLENFKAFNSEAIADTIVTSRLPIIAGIGHERDDTIADFVADQRCSTPTGAAVFIRTRHEGLINQVEDRFRNLVSAMEYIVDGQNRIIAGQAADLRTAFTAFISRYKLTVTRIASQMQAGFSRIFDSFRTLKQDFVRTLHQYESSIRDQAHELDIIIQQSLHLIERKFSIDSNRLNIAQTVLASLNPEAVLRRGYSIAYSADDKVLKDSKNIAPGDIMNVKLYQGKVCSVVDKVE